MNVRQFRPHVVLPLILVLYVKVSVAVDSENAAQRELDNNLRSKFVTFAKRGFEAHNKFRARHHSPSLKWSDKLAARAQKIAYLMALNGTIQVPGVDQLGENRAKISAVNYDCELAGEEAAKIWYNQGSHYSYSDPRLNSDTDSFTQLVWKESRDVGMGCAQRKGTVTNEIYVVALYYPAGNSEATLRDNVIGPNKMEAKDVYATIYRRHKTKFIKKNKIHKTAQ
ncbi:protein PRY1 [Nematostella vectensis]|uniref:protein PRY1 n=1 Tax=Nematostella vectensis TaxID=45351 RepID=UPI00207729FC|nr:protein PRY1 [Nematostella vectensis]